MGSPLALGTLVKARPARVSLRHGSFSVRLGETTHRVDIDAGGTAHVKSGGSPVLVTVETTGAASYRATIGDLSREVFVWASGDQRQVFVDGELFELEVTAAGLRPRRARPHRDELSAPMPANVREVLVSPGQVVQAGDVLVKLEAMKMELSVRAPRAGTVKSVNCRPGELVAQGIPLLEIAESTTEP